MSTKSQKFTIIGTGAVANITAASLIKKNRIIKSQIAELEKELQIATENKETSKIENFQKQIEDKESKIVKLSVLGRDENSSSYKAFRNGVRVNLKHKDGTPEIIEFDSKDFEIITTDASVIGEQDHVFVAIKRYSYNEGLFKKVDLLKKTNPKNGNETSVILGHNGLQCWSKVIGENGQVKFLDEEMYRRIGENNVYGCAINIAVEWKIENQKMICNVSTPIEKIHMPIASPSLDINKTMDNLGEVFDGGYIAINCLTEGIKQEVLEKLKINVAINALTTLLQCNIGGLFNDDLYKQIIKEFDLFAKKYYEVSLRDDDRFMARLKPVSGYYPTTMRDFFAGQPIEFSVYDEAISISESYPRRDINNRINIATIKEISKILKDATEIRDRKIAELQNKIGKNETVSEEDIKKAATEAVNDKSIKDSVDNLRLRLKRLVRKNSFKQENGKNNYNNVLNNDKSVKDLKKETTTSPSNSPSSGNRGLGLFKSIIKSSVKPRNNSADGRD